MDDPLQTSASSQPADLQSQLESLRRLTSSLLLLVLLVSLTLTIFLARQWRFTKSEIDLMGPQASQIIAESGKSLPAMQEFVKRLNEYAKTHPDFGPIANKYHLSEVLGKTGTGTAAAPGTNK